METSTPSKKKAQTKETPKFRRVYALWITLGLLVVAAFAIPLTMSNGTEKLTGDQKRAAEAELKPGVHTLPLMDTVFDFKFILKTRAERVYVTPDSTAKSWCGSVYKEGGTYYSVVLGEYTFFGIKVNEVTLHDACILM